jgi:hypothetical protein
MNEKLESKNFFDTNSQSKTKKGEKSRNEKNIINNE